MPRGHHIATCLHCLKEWVVGDCIPMTCPECYDKGHRDAFLDPPCPKCEQERLEARKRFEAANAASNPPVNPPKSKRAFGEGL